MNPWAAPNGNYIRPELQFGSFQQKLEIHWVLPGADKHY